jgi:hypothetical protein
VQGLTFSYSEEISHEPSFLFQIRLPTRYYSRLTGLLAHPVAEVGETREHEHDEINEQEKLNYSLYFFILNPTIPASHSEIQ